MKLFLYGALLIVAFQTKTSEIDFGKAEDQNARRWCYSPSRTHFDLSTPPKSVAAVCSQNELLEVPHGLVVLIPSAAAVGESLNREQDLPQQLVRLDE